MPQYVNPRHYILTNFTKNLIKTRCYQAIVRRLGYIITDSNSHFYIWNLFILFYPINIRLDGFDYCYQLLTLFKNSLCFRCYNSTAAPFLVAL